MPGPWEALPPPLPGDNRAHIHVLLPAAARLWVNGTAMTQTGAERDFTTPALIPGQTYRYEIKARWVRHGNPVERTLEVQVLPNRTTVVDFSALLAGG
jgi:uncharacterized protein (TIGR03000 family)